MNETLDFLNKLNWILKPIADLVVFLFTTKTGYLILGILFIGSITLSVYNQIRIRQLAYSAAHIPGLAKVPFIEKIFLTLRVITKMFGQILTNLPVFLSVFVFLLLVAGVSRGIEGIDTFVRNQQKIKELQSILKQLDQRYKVAEISVTDYSIFTRETTLSINFYDYAKQGFINEKQDITIKGNDIYFDAVVLNFDYSEISDGTIKNLVLPYRVFSDQVAQENGIPLNMKDENGIPLIFKRNDNEIYGLPAEQYDNRIKEIMSYITDKEKARLAGIRSVYGNAVHKRVSKGDVLSIWIEQTGGLVIKEARDF
jgi:hypothetical protein